MKFLTSTRIWFLQFLPVMLLSFLVVPIMCLTKWDGKTTWFGNFKYGRGDTHYKAPSEGKYWKQVQFLTVRNPISNFGKRVLAVEQADWVWLIDAHIVGRFYWKYGWKSEDVAKGELRTFIYRPWFHA